MIFHGQSCALLACHAWRPTRQLRRLFGTHPVGAAQSDGFAVKHPMESCVIGGGVCWHPSSIPPLQACVSQMSSERSSCQASLELDWPLVQRQTIQQVGCQLWQAVLFVKMLGNRQQLARATGQTIDLHIVRSNIARDAVLK